MVSPASLISLITLSLLSWQEHIRLFSALDIFLPQKVGQEVRNTIS